MPKDYYKILGVEKNASQDDIKRAYKKLAKQYHPDINKNADATEKFKEVNEAASVLSSAEKREHYDKFGTAEGAGQGFGFDSQNFSQGFDFDDVFDNLFSGFGFNSGRGRRTQQRGKDLAYEVEISLEDVFNGVTKKISLEKFDVCSNCSGNGSKKGEGLAKCEECNGQGVARHTRRTPFGVFATTTTCSHCQGSGEVVKEICDECDGKGRIKVSKTIDVKIPAGIEEGTRLRVQGEGEAGSRGTRAGDLYVIVYIKAHDIFERDGCDLSLEVPINFVQACLGAEIEVPTIEGKATIKIPQGTQPSTVLRMRSKGLPSLNHSGRGDQHIKIKVEVPTKLSKEQTKLLKEFEESLGKKKGWFF